MNKEQPDIMRVNSNPLSETEIADIKVIKDLGNNVHAFLELLPKNREVSLAKTKLEECVMWAVKGISN